MTANTITRPCPCAIATRWEETEGQVADSVAAMRTGDLNRANEPEEISDRQERLRAHGRDLEAIIGEDDSLWVTFLSQGLTAAKAVGRVVLPRRSQPHKAIGTGVLVSPRLLLTNNHVIGDVETAKTYHLEMAYEYDEQGGELQPQLLPLDPATAFVTDVSHDFTIVAVSDMDGVAVGDRYGTVKLIPQLGKVLKAERLNVIHHPNGDRKRISIRENRMVAEDDIWLRYASDTRPGSSGAPVFNDQWEMVALHHGSVPRRDNAGRRLTTNGQVVGETDDGSPVDYIGNEGVRVSRIIRQLTSSTEPAPAALIQEILQTGEQS